MNQTDIPRFQEQHAPVREQGEKPDEFDLQISLRTGGAILQVPGHGAIPLTSEQRQQLVEWCRPEKQA